MMDRLGSSEREAPIFGMYRTFFNSCGIYFRTDLGRRLYSVPMITFSLQVLMFLLYSIYVYLYEIEKLAVIIHHSMLVFDIFLSIVVTYSKKDLIKGLVRDMPKMYNYHSSLVDKFVRSLQSERVGTMKKVYKACITSIAIMMANVILNSFLEPFIREVDHVLVFPCWFPFSLDYMPYHIMAYLWQVWAFFLVCLNNLGMMLILYSIYSHMRCQIVLLMYSLEQIQERASELTSRQTEMKLTTKQSQTLEQYSRENYEENIRSYIICTKQCAQHHMEIIDYFTRADELTKIIYTVVLITGLVLFTCTGFALVSDNTSLKLKFVIITTIQLIFLYITSWFGEQISELSSKIRFSIYSLAWYEMPKECQTTLMLMTEGSLRPLQFTTLTGQKVNLEGYMDMLKASYSYFNMLLATQHK